MFAHCVRVAIAAHLSCHDYWYVSYAELFGSIDNIKTGDTVIVGEINKSQKDNLIYVSSLFWVKLTRVAYSWIFSP